MLAIVSQQICKWRRLAQCQVDQRQVHLSGLQMTFSRMNNKTRWAEASVSTSLLRQLRDITLLKKLLYLDLPGEVVYWISQRTYSYISEIWTNGCVLSSCSFRQIENESHFVAVRPDFSNLRNKWIGKEKLSDLLNGKNWQRFSILEWCFTHLVVYTKNYNVMQYLFHILHIVSKKFKEIV